MVLCAISQFYIKKGFFYPVANKNDITVSFPSRFPDSNVKL